MKKYLILILLIIFSLLSFGAIQDDIKLLKEEDKSVLNDKLTELEKNFGVHFTILITAQDIEPKKYMENTVKGVIIHLKRDDTEKKLKVKLYFTKDIDIYTYKTEIQKTLDDSQALVDSEKYLDLIYELTGNTSEIIHLINAEEKAETTRTWFIVAGVVVFFILSGGIAVLILYYRSKNKKKNICKFCDIDMDLVDEYQEGNKTIRLYNCHVCGHSKKISFRH